jgi:hypothetical protein
MIGTGLEGTGLEGTGLEGTGLEGQVAGRDATVTVTVTDAAAVRPVIEATLRSGTRGGQLEDRTPHVPADAGAVGGGLLRHLASPPPDAGTFPSSASRRPPVVVQPGSAPAAMLVYLHAQGPCR